MTLRSRNGLPRGERHHKATLTNPEIDRLREMADAGWSYSQLARVFEMSKGGVAKIVKCVNRATVPVLAR